jgi:hypothetical protein
MREKFEAAMISRRRAFWILGLGAALGLGMPVAMLTTPDAEAQTPGTAKTPDTAKTPGTAQTGTPGSKRRQDRRTSRDVRRKDRRTARDDRRKDRRGTDGQEKK